MQHDRERRRGRRPHLLNDVGVFAGQPHALSGRRPTEPVEERRMRMLKLLRRRVASEAGFTLMELLVVVIIVGILAAVGVPLYLGYVRDSRLAEAKALAGSVLTAAQACAQQNTPNEAANCTRAQLAPKVGIDVGTGATGDGRWVVTVTPVTLNAATNQWGVGPIQVAGVAIGRAHV